MVNTDTARRLYKYVNEIVMNDFESAVRVGPDCTKITFNNQNAVVAFTAWCEQASKNVKCLADGRGKLIVTPWINMPGGRSVY